MIALQLCLPYAWQLDMTQFPLTMLIYGWFQRLFGDNFFLWRSTWPSGIWSCCVSPPLKRKTEGGKPLRSQATITLLLLLTGVVKLLCVSVGFPRAPSGIHIRVWQAVVRVPTCPIRLRSHGFLVWALMAMLTTSEDLPFVCFSFGRKNNSHNKQNC